MGESNPTTKSFIIKQSIDHFKRASEILPDYKQTWYFMGNAYYNLGDINTAEKMYSHTLKLDSTDIKALNFLGVISSMKGNNDTASELFQKAITLDSSNADGYANLGNLYLFQGKALKAINILSVAYRIDQKNENVLLNLIDAYKILGNADNAVFYEMQLTNLKNKKNSVVN